MMRATGRYANQRVELDQPIALDDDTEVEVEIRPARREEAGWAELGMNRLDEEWDNSADAVYDDWKRLYGAQPR